MLPGPRTFAERTPPCLAHDALSIDAAALSDTEPDGPLGEPGQPPHVALRQVQACTKPAGLPDRAFSEGRGPHTRQGPARQQSLGDSSTFIPPE